MQYYSDLNCLETISKVAKRLPSGLHSKWLRAVATIKRRNCKPNFRDLMGFVKKEPQYMFSCYTSAASRKKYSKTSVKTEQKIIANTMAMQGRREPSMGLGPVQILRIPGFVNNSKTDRENATVFFKL